MSEPYVREIGRVTDMDAERGSCEGGRHYYVKQGGQWVCSICGSTR